MVVIKINRLTGYFVAAVLFLCSSGTLVADDGQLEINQACVASGCIPGDTPGFPVEITSAGSYLLTSKLTAPAGNVDGIVISADNITLDLNGFELEGGAHPSSAGIEVLSRLVNVDNGTIHGFGTGMRLVGGAGFGDNSRATNLTIYNVRNFGILLGAQSLVENCDIDSEFNGIILGDRSIARSNRINLTDPAFTNSNGILVGEVGLVQDNVVAGTPGDGLRAGAGSTVTGNTVRASRASGILLAGNGTLVEGNTVTNSQNFGIEFDGTGNHLVRGNNAFNNNQSGGGFTNIEACATCTFVENHAP